MVRISTIPTLKERQGIFTGVSKIYDPATTRVQRNNVFAHGVSQRCDRHAVRSGGGGAAGAASRRRPERGGEQLHPHGERRRPQNQFDVRVDGALGTSDRAFGRYSYYSEVEQPVTPLPDGSGLISGSVLGAFNYAGLSHVLGQQAVFNETHTFTPHLLNDLRLGYTRRGNTTDGVSLGEPASQALGIPGIPTNAAFNNALPLFTFTGFQQLGVVAEHLLAVSDGRVAAGGHGELRAWRAFGKGGRGFPLVSAEYRLAAEPDGLVRIHDDGHGPAERDEQRQRDRELSARPGGYLPDRSATAKIRPRDHIQEYFVQDDWKAMPRLTLNIGARWTLHLPSTEKNNQGAVFNLATQQLDYLGVNGYPSTARELHWDNVAPRIGLTYHVDSEDGGASGFGIVFIDQSGITTPFTTPQFPFIQNVQQKTQDSVNAAFALRADRRLRRFR